MANLIRAVDEKDERSLLRAPGHADYYVLDRGTRKAYPVLKKEWEQWIASGAKRLMWRDFVKIDWPDEPTVEVVTAFDGRNQDPDPNADEPMLFETKIYGGSYKGRSAWSGNWDDAALTHKVALAIVAKFDAS